MKARSLRLLVSFALFGMATQTNAQLEGTLFTRPDEREYLDYLREEFLRNSAEDGFNIEEVAIPEIPEGEIVEDTGPQEFTFGGIMTRRDGSRSLWLNGRVLAERELPEGMSLVENGGSASLQISSAGNIFVLRPGQTVDLTTGSVIENFQRVPVSEPAQLPEVLQEELVAGDEADATVPDAADEPSIPDAELSAASSAEAIGNDLGENTSEVESPASEEKAEDRAATVADALSQMEDEDLSELVEVIQRIQEEKDDEP